MATLHQLVSVYLNEADRWERRPLHLEILKFLQKSGCAGGTVLRGMAGFTSGARGLTSPAAGSKGKLPIVVQFIDVPEKVAGILPTLQKMAGKRLITVQPVEVLSPHS
jgi:PII-like signaling protein